MKTTLATAILLIVLGVAAAAYLYEPAPSRESLARLGPIEAAVERQSQQTLSPLIALLPVAAGIALLLARGRKA